MKGKKINKFVVALLEDDQKFRHALEKELKGIQSIAEIVSFGSAETFRKNKQKFDIVFLDLGLPDKDGIFLIQEILEKNPECKVIILSIIQDEGKIFFALRSGACGYILKSDIFNIKEIVKQLQSTGGIMTPTIAYKVMQYFRSSDEEDEKKLSKQEKNILSLIVDGNSTKEVAEFMKTSEGTVRNQIKSIYKKLHVNSRVELLLKSKKQK